MPIKKGKKKKKNKKKFEEVEEHCTECAYYDEVIQKLEMPVEQLINIMKDKTLLFTERTFPFRVKSEKLKVVRYKDDFFFKDLGVGFYFQENAMDRGSEKIGHLVFQEYELIEGKFVIPHVRPEIIKFIRLKQEHKSLFGKEVLKVYLLSTYFSTKMNKYYAIYVDEREARPYIPQIAVI